MEGGATEAAPQVLVVGAGPTGLLLAAELERRDVPCLLIDALDQPRGWDRATVVHPRSMEIFEALGLAERFLDEGVRTRAARFHSGGEVLGELDLGLTPGCRYGFDLGVSEEVTERIVTGRLEALGGSVTRSTRLLDLDQSGDRVRATLERNGEREVVEVDWVVGCDGLRSTVREIAGIEFAGSDIEAPWAVFDAATAGWHDEHDVAAAFLDLPPVILTPLPGRRWRVYMRPTDAEADLVEEATAVVERYAADVEFEQVENPARFHCHSRVAERYREGRLLLAGDAAHACTPAEGHGMNTGLQDAFNLGWKLALVCRGEAGERLLESYEPERRPVALRVVESGADAEASHALSAARQRAERDSAIRATFAATATAHHEAAAAAEVDRSYASSPIVFGEADAGVAAGRRLPDGVAVRPPAAGEPTQLHSIAHTPGHTLVVIGGPRADAGAVAALVDEAETAHAGSPLVDAIVGLAVEPAGEPLGTIERSEAERLGIDSVTLVAIRPDRYLGLRHDGADTAVFTRYLETLVA